MEISMLLFIVSYSAALQFGEHQIPEGGQSKVARGFSRRQSFRNPWSDPTPGHLQNKTGRY